MRTITDLQAAFDDLEEAGREHLAELARDSGQSHSVAGEQDALSLSQFTVGSEHGTKGDAAGAPTSHTARRRRIAAPVAAAALVAATAIGLLATASGSGTGPARNQAGDTGWSTAPIATHPTWQCPSGEKPTSTYLVGIDRHGPTGLHSITEYCLGEPQASPSAKPKAMSYSRIGVGNTVTVTVEPAGAFTPPAPGSGQQRVSVNGVTGYYTSASYRGTTASYDATAAELYWAYAPDSYVVVASNPGTSPSEAHGVPASTLIAVAQSGEWRGKTATVPLRLSATPAGTTLMAVTTYTTTALNNLADLFFYNRTTGQTVDITLSAAPLGPTPKATPTTIAGHPAVIDRSGAISMQTGGAWLYVASQGGSQRDAQEPAKIAAAVATVPNPTDRAGWYSIATAVPDSQSHGH